MLLPSGIKQYGDLKLQIYDFELAGDILPMHNHEDDTVHITIVARGKIKAHGDGWERELSCGQLVDFKSGQEHEFIALEDNSRIININKNYLFKS